jgi:hypothetical protein
MNSKGYGGLFRITIHLEPLRRTKKNFQPSFSVSRQIFELGTILILVTILTASDKFLCPPYMNIFDNRNFLQTLCLNFMKEA